VLNIFKGWLGEKTTTFGMWFFLDENIYHRIDNIIVPAHDGTTQIDHVLISVYGVFVIETKNLKGWIYGSANDRQWTQNLFGKKFHFQNPLHQNYRHTKCLSEYLGLDHNLFRSVVFFISECEFKTEMPDNVVNAHLGRYFKKFTQPCLTVEQVKDIGGKLLPLKAGHSITKAEHLHSLEVRHESMNCPKCGGQLKERTAKHGANAGGRFFGCSNHPRCKYTRNI
jgi:restriction system protein